MTILKRKKLEELLEKVKIIATGVTATIFIGMYPGIKIYENHIQKNNRFCPTNNTKKCATNHKNTKKTQNPNLHIQYTIRRQKIIMQHSISTI